MADAEENKDERRKYKRRKSDHNQDQSLKSKPLEAERIQDQHFQHQALKSEQRDKLGKFFQQIISHVPVDFSNQEIHDIQDAVNRMLGRIKASVNRRGIFKIDRIMSTGSMAEKTSVWKYTCQALQDYHLEFDFLAVLEASIGQCENQTTAQNSCQGGIRIVNPPIELEQLRQQYREIDFSVKAKTMINQIFLNEINFCLTSSCDRHKRELNAKHLRMTGMAFLRQYVGPCGTCSVDTPSGILSVHTQMTIGYNPSSGSSNCSLKLKWTSKANSIHVPAFDRLLSQKCQQISSLLIDVDFLPALESLKPTPSRDGEEHDFFIVPKRCNVCGGGGCGGEREWRKSWCMAEVHAFTTEMSDKHIRCYQIMKYLKETFEPEFINNYHIKTVALRHHTTCSDTTNSCVDCVTEMFQDLLHAYNTGELLSYKSNLNILVGAVFCEIPCKLLLDKLCSVSETESGRPSSESSRQGTPYTNKT